jgi:hypothetical protein
MISDDVLLASALTAYYGQEVEQKSDGGRARGALYIVF